MMLIDTVTPSFESARPERVRVHRGPGTSGRAYPVQTRPVRLARSRPGGAPLRHRGAGVLMSRTPHRPQPVKAITPATTVALALIAAAITVWLGLIAQFGAAAAGGGTAVPEQLGVVRVQSGESLQRLAARVAPDAPTGQVVERIRELNSLESVALDAGQTLIAPLG
ncbi:LysM peptidoglycan-binding domain-containing protein [Mycolicibacter longobardus]|uniref:Peptigoglycan-binding protein LysM n=1 Tax=Mycolicibacter longobardus TaxID=1108812 RepID=A0A1X1YP17_9MYCO|nr:LysM peptidoglycan-binding domain-containing protein [Mycolicibacter longobardus]MCV7384262.1 LysM peptidoglycan-binding domain-containing protein [Mycolicibacter longobardus]ORW12760.1 peptigoglycan-binding protein LysM [Mycolicibacter longobardus]